MSAQYQYRLIDGKYVLHQGDAPYLGPMEMVAIAFDSDDGTLLKHGEPARVRDWARLAVEALRNSEHPELSHTLTVIEGRFTLDDLDKILSITGFMSSFVKHLAAGKACMLDELGNVVRMDGTALSASD